MLVAIDTASPYIIDFVAEHAGQRAHYLLRWLGSNDAKGPWSEVVSATIGG